MLSGSSAASCAHPSSSRVHKRDLRLKFLTDMGLSCKETLKSPQMGTSIAGSVARNGGAAKRARARPSHGLARQITRAR